ncbi:MAG: hypothetical protein IJ191_03280 [Treponema sp.]|nr:hypothetical protein [Treponema sp.]
MRHRAKRGFFLPRFFHYFFSVIERGKNRRPVGRHKAAHKLLRQSASLAGELGKLSIIAARALF